MSAIVSATSSTDGQNVALVHDELRARILHGALTPGEEISQVKLAKALGVSRTPLREALRMLQREGLVEGSANGNRQYRVAGFSLEDMEELYVARLTLESVGIRITTPRLTPEDVAELEADMAKMAHFADLEDYERFEVPHRAFHARLVSCAGDRLTVLLSQLSDHAMRYRRLYTTEAPEGWSAGKVEHRAILDAVKARDADDAARQLVEHLAHVGLGVIQLVDPAYDASRLRTAIAMACTPLETATR